MNLFNLQKYRLIKSGMTLVEVIISLAIFVLLVGAASQAYLYSNRVAIQEDDKAIALNYAEEGIEATRSIRDQNYSLLTAGTKGLGLVSNTWQFVGTSDVNNGFLRRITLTAVDADTFNVVSQVDWSYKGATSSVSLNTRLTNWRKTVAQSSGLNINTSGAYLSLLDSYRLLTNIVLTTDGSVATTTISSVTVSWSGVVSTRRLQQILSPTASQIWSGTGTSGSTFTLSPAITMTGATSRNFQLRYNANMNGGSFTLTFNFSDGSTKTVSFTPVLGA